MSTTAAAVQAGAESALQIAFPAFPSHNALRALDLMRQLAASQRFEPQRLARLQAAPLRALMAHAGQHSEFWRERLGGAGVLLPEDATAARLLASVEPLHRHDVQERRDAMRAMFPGRERLSPVMVTTSGSSGVPVKVEKTKLVQLPLYSACLLLFYASAGFDPARRTGLLRSRLQDRESFTLGAPFTWLFGRDPPAFSLTTRGRSAAELYPLVARLRPNYLACGPTTARRLAEHALATGAGDLRVDACFTLGSTVTPETREIVREGLGARIWDCYSTEETGWIAIQCPRHDHYHVVSPLVLVEIVDGDGRPCAPGEVGSVLVTPLHSYAMPLIRYEVGDLAQWGRDCDCGIRWPVISNIVGRTRHLIAHPDGTRSYPRIYAREFARVPGLREYRLTLHSDRVVVAQVLMAPAPTETQRAQIVDLVQRAMGYPYPVTLRQVDAIDWGRSGKQDDFAVSPEPSGAGD